MSPREDRERLSTNTIKALDSLESLWSVIEEARHKSGIYTDEALAERPPDSLTTMEYAKRYGLEETTARRQLNKLVKRGHLERHVAYVVDCGGRAVRQNIFIPIRKP